MRIRGPTAWFWEDDGQIDVSVACRDCGWESEKTGIDEPDVHAEIDRAQAAFDAHACPVQAKILRPIFS